jgi:polyhydroxyalkanoate synthesis regulator phasin
MAKDDLLRRYQEAGTEFIEATLARAEELFREVVRIGDMAQKQATERVEDFRDVSRRTNENLLEIIRRELTNQMSQLSVATKADLARIEAQLDEMTGGRSGAAFQAAVRAAGRLPGMGDLLDSAGAGEGEPAPGPVAESSPPKSAAKRAPGKKTTAAKGASTDGTTKKAAAKKSTAKKAAARKGTAKKAATQSTATKSTATKSTATKSTAKKSAAAKRRGGTESAS